MRKKIQLTEIISVFILFVVLFSMISVPAFAARNVKVQTPAVAAALPLLWMEENDELAGIVDLEITISPDHNRALSLLAKNELDMVITGTNVGAKFYNKGVNLKLMNVNTWAVDYLLSNDPGIKDWQDLSGHTLSLPLRGGPLDFLALYLLQENGVNPETVDIVYRPLPGGARYFMGGKVDTILLPEPLVTVTLAQSKNAQLIMDVQEEWGKFHAGDNRIPFVALFAGEEFAAENPEIAKAVNGMYIKGINWVNENPEEAAKLGAKYFDMPPKVLQTSFSRINLNYYSQRENRKLVHEFFSEMMKMYPEILGGKIPDEEFYF